MAKGWLERGPGLVDSHRADELYETASEQRGDDDAGEGHGDDLREKVPEHADVHREGRPACEGGVPWGA